MTENEGIIQKYIDDGHDNGIDGQHFCAGDAYIQGTEHYVNKREEEPEHSPLQELAGGIVDIVR